MSLQEAALRLTPVELGRFEVPTFDKAEDIEDAVELLRSENSRRDTLNTYRRFPNPLVKLHRRDGLPDRSYAAGLAYGKIYCVAWGYQSPPHSDPTRIVVDGGLRHFEPPAGDKEAQAQLKDIERMFGAQTCAILDAVCGKEQSIRKYAFAARLDRRAVKTRLFEALDRLGEHWKRH